MFVLVAVVALGIQSRPEVFTSQGFRRLPQGLALPPANSQPLPPVYSLPGHGTSLGTCIYADTGYHLLRSEKRQCYLQFSLSFIEMNCLKYVSFGIVSSSCNFAAISPGWVQLQGREAILASSQRDLTEGIRCLQRLWKGWGSALGLGFQNHS